MDNRPTVADAGAAASDADCWRRVWLSGTTMHQHTALVRQLSFSAARDNTVFLNSRMASQQSKSRRSPYLGCDAGSAYQVAIWDADMLRQEGVES